MKKQSALRFVSLIFLISFCLFAGYAAADISRTLYVMNGSAETLSKMDMETEQITQNIVPVGQAPNFITTHNQMVYVVNSTTDDVMVIDPFNDQQIAKTIALETGNNPWAMGFVGTSKAYVTNYNDNSVSVIDVETGVVLKNIEVGKSPEGILVYGNMAFVTNTGYAGWGAPYEQSSVSIIDVLTDSVTHTVEVPTNAQDLAIDPSGRIHVICTGDYADIPAQIAVIDLYTGDNWDTPAVVDTFEIGGSPGDIAITTEGKGYCVAWGDGVNGYLYSYDALTDSVLHGADNPILIGPNVSRLLYDAQENALWIPYMAEWGGDGFVQKFDVDADSVVWTSHVVGNGTQDLAILEPILTSDPWADAVASISLGAGATFGSNYFPDNILGPPDPDPAINEYNASAKPQELLSLGSGGEIVLEFVDNYIYDGEGVDFTVFENVFVSSWTGEPYIEAAIVAVSMDGVNFVEFPYDTSTWEGLAGVSPTKDSQNPTDPAVSGGDQFDLADVGLEYARFVKLTDLGDIKQEGAYNGDFDLDAVVAVNSKDGQPASLVQERVRPDGFALAQNYPNPFNPETMIPFTLDQTAQVELTVFNMLGQKVQTLVQGTLAQGAHQVVWNGCDAHGNRVMSGVYLYRLKTPNHAQIRKMTIMK